MTVEAIGTRLASIAGLTDMEDLGDVLHLALHTSNGDEPSGPMLGRIHEEVESSQNTIRETKHSSNSSQLYFNHQNMDEEVDPFQIIRSMPSSTLSAATGSSTTLGPILPL